MSESLNNDVVSAEKPQPLSVLLGIKEKTPVNPDDIPDSKVLAPLSKERKDELSRQEVDIEAIEIMKKIRKRRLSKEDDMEIVQKTTKYLIDRGSSAIDTLLAVAIQSESSRDYEVVAALIASLAKVTEQLMTAHRNAADADKTYLWYGDGEKDPANVTNNNILFQGSTAQLQDFLEDLGNKKPKVKQLSPADGD